MHTIHRRMVARNENRRECNLRASAMTFASDPSDSTHREAAGCERAHGDNDRMAGVRLLPRCGKQISKTPNTHNFQGRKAAHRPTRLFVPLAETNPSLLCVFVR